MKFACEHENFKRAGSPAKAFFKRCFRGLPSRECKFQGRKDSVLDGPNRQSPIASERSQLSQAFRSYTWNEYYREEHSMDQCRSRLKLSENFERHWSIPISGEIHMDQSLVHTFSWGNSYGPMVLKVLQKFPPTLVLVHGWLFPTLHQ